MKKFGNSFILIAGPCVIEERETVHRVAEEIARIAERLGFSFIFKSSYTKANRSSVTSFTGPGLKDGLKILSEIKRELKIPITTDVHCKTEIDKVADVADIIQIPAFLCRQTELITESAKKRPVNIKKGQFMSPYDIRYAVEKARSVGGEVLVTERGTTFGYNNLVVDFRSFPIMRELGVPVIFDATHSVAYPGGKSSSGERRFIPYLIRAAVACGIDGIFLEVHPEPEKALCDRETQMRLSDVEGVLREAKVILEALR
jgi:2-dehydro-3-deoxyphosphooctonate aldolase (KDO 8-P synthase)